MKKIIFILRIFLGCIFIYSGFFKLFDARDFLEVILRLEIFSYWFINILQYLFPLLEIILGFLLIWGKFEKYVGLSTLVLITIFIITSIFIVLKGDLGHCGCFPKDSILNTSDPYLLILRNYFFLMLALVIFSNSESMEKNFFKKYNNYLTWIIFTSFVVSLLLISYARFETNINNKIYLFGERDKIQKKVDKIKFSKLPKYVLKNERMELVTIPPFEKKMNVLLIIDSFECKPCVDEILFINNLKNKYKEKVGFFCIVKQIGKTAISNLKQKYSIQFPVLQDERNRLFSDLYISPFSIKLLVSKNGSILYIDPPAFQINSIQQIFIDRLEMALR